MRELATHQNTLQQIGVSPEQAWQTYQQSPEGFSQLTDLIGMHAVGPEKYFDIQDKAAGRDIDRGKLAEAIRSNPKQSEATRLERLFSSAGRISPFAGKTSALRTPRFPVRFREQNFRIRFSIVKSQEKPTR